MMALQDRHDGLVRAQMCLQCVRTSCMPGMLFSLLMTNTYGQRKNSPGKCRRRICISQLNRITEKKKKEDPVVTD